jgi:non-heme chloroperoxidase
VVLLHGITDSWRSFEPLLAELPESVRAIAVSQRGHGDSDRPATYATRDFADDVAALLDALGLARTTILGHSMGSIVARRFAADPPARTTSLVLVGTFGRLAGRDDIAELAELAETFASLADPIDPGFVREFQAGTLAGTVPETFFETIVAESCKVPVRVFQDALTGMCADDSFDDLHRITAPTLIAWGDQDPYCSPADLELVRAQIAGSRLSTYEGVSHSPHWERPERFARELAAFVVDVR